MTTPSSQHRSATMEIGSAYSASGLWDLNALNGVDSSSQKSSSTGQSGSSGDTVDISDEARKLFSEKICGLIGYTGRLRIPIHSIPYRAAQVPGEGL